MTISFKMIKMLRNIINAKILINKIKNYNFVLGFFFIL